MLHQFIISWSERLQTQLKTNDKFTKNSEVLNEILRKQCLFPKMFIIGYKDDTDKKVVDPEKQKEPSEIATDDTSSIGVLENVNVSLTRDLINKLEECKEET